MRKEGMELSGNRVFKFGVIFVSLCCMFFANFISIRIIARCAVDTYFYDKLLVAYTIGGPEGLRMELSKIPVTDNSPREAMLAKDFAVRLETLTDPGIFLQDKVDKNKKMVNSIRGFRSAAIYIMLILLGWRLIVKSGLKFKPDSTA
ncbi:MAG: hypothetical protein PHR73_01790 [Candidatus Omnitrophica bacterium]|nr:hypothetical protein [Candidatus Omnitrophota bacterium]